MPEVVGVVGDVRDGGRAVRDDRHVPTPRQRGDDLVGDEPGVRKAAARLAEEGFDCAVINPRFTKPLDAGTHEFFGRAADLIVTPEDHTVMGGYGSAVLGLFSAENVMTPLVRIGWPDQFIEHASTVDELRKKYGLTVENTVAKVKAQFGEAAAMLQIPRNEDFNGARQDGVGIYQVTQKGGERWTSSRAYVEPALSRPNFHVVTEALAERGIEEGPCVVGVGVLSQLPRGCGSDRHGN